MDATPARVTRSIYCSATVNSPFNIFSYEVVEFASGFVFVSGDVKNTDGQASDASVWAPQQTGYATAPVFLFIAGSSDDAVWRISLNRQTLTFSMEDVASMNSWTSTGCMVVTY